MQPSPTPDTTAPQENLLVIGGSLQKYLPEIQAIHTIFRLLNWTITAPASIRPINNDAFVRLEGDDPEKSNVAVEAGYLAHLFKARAFYVVNRDNYVGMSAATEMLYALAKQVPVITAYRIDRFGKGIPYDAAVLIRKHIGTVIPSHELPEKFEESVHSFIKPVLNAEELTVVRECIGQLMRELAGLDKLEHQFLDNLEEMSLGGIQSYVKDVATLRGFNNESLLTKMSIMGSQIGDVMEASRPLVGGLTALDRSTKTLGHSLADCLFVLADIANIYRISLEEALRQYLRKRGGSTHLVVLQQSMHHVAAKRRKNLQCIAEKDLALLKVQGNLASVVEDIIKKTPKTKSLPAFQQTIGELLFELIDLANSQEISLAKAFQAMEQQNRLRAWESREWRHN